MSVGSKNEFQWENLLVKGKPNGKNAINKCTISKQIKALFILQLYLSRKNFSLDTFLTHLLPFVESYLGFKKIWNMVILVKLKTHRQLSSKKK